MPQSATDPGPAAGSDATALLAENGAEWLAAVARRHSRRFYDRRPVASETLDALDSICSGFRPYPDARTVLVRSPSTDIFTGALGSYGKVTGSPHVLLFVGDEHADFCDQHVGYTGEAAILAATFLDLNTCWVGGFFNAARARELTDILPGERVLAVSPVGHATKRPSLSERTLRRFAGSHTRKSVDEIAPGLSDGWPDWAVAAVETARLAPSATNRQPWRFRFDAGALDLARDNAIEFPRVTKRLDCGIVMLHAELGARAAGADGAWLDSAKGLDVARYVTIRRAD
jgi:hypothetical protein